MSRNISNMDDTIDSRDVIERIEELANEREALIDALHEANVELAAFDPEDGGGDEAELQQNAAHAKASLATWEATDEAEELQTLSKLADEGENSADDWQYGAQLIRDSYFVTAMQELLEDIGDLPKDLPHYIEIDWDRTARNLRMDYTSVDFDGVTYWVR